jgi:hypothetical protein
VTIYDTFKLSGHLSIRPPPAIVVTDFTIENDVLEQVSVTKKLAGRMTLDADGPEVLNLADMTAVHVVQIKVDQKVVVRLTSADGSVQAIPVDPYLLLISRLVGFTAITVERLPNVATSVQFVLAQAG